MPSHKNRLKLTGDTHLPDARFDYAPEEDNSVDLLAAEDDQALVPRVYADGYVPPAQEVQEPEEEPAGMKAKVEAKLGAVEARSPWLAVGAMLAFGWLVARMLR